MFEFLHTLKPTKYLITRFKQKILDKLNAKIDIAKDKSELVNIELTKLKTRLQKAEEAFELGVYSQSKLIEKRDEFEPRIIDLEGQIDTFNISKHEFETCLNRASEFLQFLPKVWLKLDSKEKTMLHRILFLKGIFYEKHTIATPELACIFKVIDDVKTGEVSKYGCWGTRTLDLFGVNELL